jgi:hypothetical protein
VKRTLVAFWLNRAIAHSVPTEPRFTDEEVMRWTILHLRWPTLVNGLATAPAGERDAIVRKTLGGRQHSDYEAVTAGLDVDKAFTLFRA